MTGKRTHPIRVLIADDSPTARALLVAILQGAEGIDVVGTAADGEEAIRLAARLRPDVITMDVRMPKMNGLEATRQIMQTTPTRVVIVTASLTWNDMDLSFEILRAGALTIVLKPGMSDPETSEKVVRTVRLMADVPVVQRRAWGIQRANGTDDVPGTSPAAVLSEQEVTRAYRAVAIACSTGGPAALAAVLGALPVDFPIPILIVQHITSGFVSGLAGWLSGVTSLRVSVAGHGDLPQPGTVLLAPDDYHMQVNAQGRIELLKDVPYRGLRPSANYLFHSLARHYGAQTVGVVLTGMGDDGAEGLQAIHDKGGLTIAQEEKSCVVFGMPREAIARKAVERVLSPKEIGILLRQLQEAGRGGDQPLP